MITLIARLFSAKARNRGAKRSAATATTDRLVALALARRPPVDREKRRRLAREILREMGVEA